MKVITLINYTLTAFTIAYIRIIDVFTMNLIKCALKVTNFIFTDKLSPLISKKKAISRKYSNDVSQHRELDVKLIIS